MRLSESRLIFSQIIPAGGSGYAGPRLRLRTVPAPVPAPAPAAPPHADIRLRACGFRIHVRRIPRRPRRRPLHCGCRCVTPSWRWGKRGKFALAKITTSTLDPGHDAINKVLPPFVFVVPLHVTLFSERALQALHRTKYRTAQRGDYGLDTTTSIYHFLVQC